MTNSYKKASSGVSRPGTARSSSTKKSTVTNTTVVRSNKKKPSWDDSNHDLSVHKLPMKKILEKKLQMMSKETLCKIAGLDAPHRPPLRQREDLLSPPLRRIPKRITNDFDSPEALNGESSSAGSTPESGNREETSSVESTPEDTHRQQQQYGKREMIVHTVRPSTKKTIQQSVDQRQPVPVEPVHQESQHLARRRSASLQLTVAPPKAHGDEHDMSMVSNSSYAQEDLSASTASSSHQSYEPWLKPDSFLSPVLERSIESSTIAGSPSPAENASPAITRAMVQAEKDEILRAAGASDFSHKPADDLPHGRNLLNELRSNLASEDVPAGAFIEPAFLPLLNKLSAHLAEQPGRQQQEKQFKSTVVESFGQAAAQVKSLQARVEEVETENRHLKHQFQSMKLDHDSKEQSWSKQLRAVEAKVEQLMGMVVMMGRQGNGQTAPVSQLAPSPYNVKPYDPSAYTGPGNVIASVIQRDYSPAASVSEQHQQRSRAEHILFPSSMQVGPSPVGPAPVPLTAPQNARRDASPPRPIVLGGRSQQPQQINPVHGARLSDVVSVVRQPVPLPTRTQTQSSNPVIQPVQPTQKVAWETYARPGANMQHSPIKPPHTAFRSTALSSDASFTRDASGVTSDDELDNSVSEPMPRSGHSLAVPQRNSHATPMSPGEQEEMEEAARFERETAKARAMIAGLKGNESNQQRPQTAGQQRPTKF